MESPLLNRPSLRLSTYVLPLLLVTLAGASTGCGLFGRGGALSLRPNRNQTIRINPNTNASQPVAATNLNADPRTALEQVETHLTSRGYVRVGPAVRNTNMPQNGLVAYPVDAAPGQCFVALAVSTPTNDVNLFLIDPEGRQMAHNVRPDQHPWIEVCPQTAGRHIARVQMVRGAGEYYYALYQHTGPGEPQLAELFGQAQQVETVTAADLDPATRGRVAAVDAQLRGQNYSQVAEPQGVRLGPRQDRTFPLNLQANTCYTFATFGGPGTEDTDVFVVNGNGDELAADQAQARDGQVEFCPSHPGAYTLRARLYSGNGPVFVAAWARVEGSTGGTVSSNVSSGGIVGAAAAGAGLDERFGLLDADMLARGYEHYGEPAVGELQSGQSQDFAISLEGNKCYAVVAVGDGGVRDLDLAVLDSRGRELDRDVETGARPIVRVCPERSGDSRIQVRMASGGGAFRYAAYRWPRGTRGPFDLNGLIYVRLAEVTSLLQVDGYQPSADFLPEKSRIRREGGRANHSVFLPSGRCLAVLVVGGDGMHNVDASISVNGRALSRDDSNNAFPDLRFCTQVEGQYDLQITAAAGSGEYFYQVFERQ